MPSYDYFCPANGKTLEARHRISEKLGTWRELCELTGTPLGETPADSPIERLITGTQVVSSSALRNPEPPCGSGCSTGVCSRHG